MKKALRLYDNTRISCFRGCPRKYFFRHVLHWKSSRENRIPLIFGHCWHTAMEVVWPAMAAGIPKHKIMEMAYAAWLEDWQKEGMPHPRDIDYELQQELNPRTPHNAQEMLVDYIDKRYDQWKDMELISCEQAFIVPLDPEDDTLFYVGKIDKVVRKRGKYTGIEHKTSTAYAKSGGFRSQFLDSFSPNSQVDGYLYTLHMTYPDKVGGVWVDAALVHRTETAFQFIPINRQLQHLDMWLWETRSWIDEIEANTKHMQEVCKPEDRYMAAFKKDTDRCWDFNSACEFLDPCKAWANPLGHDIPPGYKVEKWDPLDHLPPNAGELLKGIK